MDAIAMLKTQHAEVDALFEKLDHETNDADWHDLLGRLVDRLTMHAALEEEIFYPAVAVLPGKGEVVAHARDEHGIMASAERLGAAALRDLAHEMETRMHVGETLDRRVAANRGR